MLHANYWLSGAVAHQLKHRRDLPMVATFHTLARVKADAGIDDDPDERARVEHAVIACSDLMLASTDAERDQLAMLYDAVPERVEVVPPGVDHSVFFPDRRRRRQGAPRSRRPARCCCSRAASSRSRVSGIAVRCLAELDDPDRDAARGRRSERPRRRTRSWPGCARSPTSSASPANVHFVPPQPHTRLADYYRAADVCIVPSRAESFGLVALEAAACGTPVVAASVGGLRSLVDDGATGFLVDGRDPAAYAAPVAMLLDDPELAAEMGATASAAFAQVLVEHHRRAAPPPLRRSRRAGSRSLRLT